MVIDEELSNAIKEVIKEGYNNLETISFELDIPMDVLVEIKEQALKEIELESSMGQINSEIAERIRFHA